MIKKQQEFGISKDATVIELGKGDVIICDLDWKEEPFAGIGFVQDVPQPVNTDHPDRNGKNQYEIKYDVIIKCDNVESLKVLQRAVSRARYKLEKKN
jgi:hypothetical protein